MTESGFRRFPAASTKRDDPPQGPDRGSTALLERQEIKAKTPPLYQVLLLNDVFTPMEFVVFVIQQFFGRDLETATQIMLKIHLDGKGICGVYTKDVAASKVDQVQDAAHQAGHPLQALLEPIE